MKTHQIITASLLLSLFGSPTPTDATTITNSAKQNIFGAGKLIPPQPGGGGGGVLPVQVGLPQGLDRVLFFTSVTGSVNFANGLAGYTFDEDGHNQNNWSTDAFPWDGISGIYATNRIGFLTGCFLAGNEPTDPAPLSILVTNTDFISVSPQVAQLFFIGDGKTTNEQTQLFRIPDEATRLFLGFADSANILIGGYPGWYDDNIGEIVASFQITGLAPRISTITNSSKSWLITVTNLVPGLSNRLVSTVSLPSTNWAYVQGFISPAAGVFQCIDTNAVEPVKFYRIETTVP